MRTLLVTSLYSPFQIELAREIVKLGKLDLHIVFTLPERDARGSHWKEANYDDMRDRIEVIEGPVTDAKVTPWVKAQIEKRTPEVVIAGAMAGPIHRAVHLPRAKRDWTLGFWNEPPNFLKRGRAYRLARKVGYATRLRHADFVLAIGDRALRYYGSVVQNAAFVPYGEDLSACLESDREPDPRGRVRFVYSGQLIARQNTPVLVESIVRTHRLRPSRFSVTLAASGPQENLVTEAVRANPGLEDVICFDRDFSSWTDRLRPFWETDVFLYPSRHAGWGLVIPEAMAAGCIPVTTRYVEAARTMVEDEVSGFITEPTAEHFTAAMLRLIDNPAQLEPMRPVARRISQLGHAPNVAKRFTEAVLRFA